MSVLEVLYKGYSHKYTMIEPFEHNKTAYKAALELLEKTSQAFVIHSQGHR